MCDINVYLLSKGHETLVMENVDEVFFQDNKVRMLNIFGEVKTVNATVSEFNNTKKKIVLTPIA